MTKERALALKGQEERLGAMITALQMEKAREVVLGLLYCTRSIYSHFVADSCTHRYMKPALLAVS